MNNEEMRDGYALKGQYSLLIIDNGQLTINN